MKIRSPLPARKTRLEIIPLIDVMFFLLASFMMVSLTNQGRKAADLLGKAPDQTSSMLDCLNETELQTLHGYLQRIIDTSSDDLPASTAEDVKKCELLIEHLKRRRMPTDRA